MANLKFFKGLKSHVLVKEIKTPICIGPLPPIEDVKLVTNENANHGQMI